MPASSPPAAPAAIHAAYRAQPLPRPPRSGEQCRQRQRRHRRLRPHPEPSRQQRRGEQRRACAGAGAERRCAGQPRERRQVGPGGVGVERDHHHRERRERRQRERGDGAVDQQPAQQTPRRQQGQRVQRRRPHGQRRERPGDPEHPRQQDLVGDRVVADREVVAERLHRAGAARVEPADDVGEVVGDRVDVERRLERHLEHAPARSAQQGERKHPLAARPPPSTQAPSEPPSDESGDGVATRTSAHSASGPAASATTLPDRPISPSASVHASTNTPRDRRRHEDPVGEAAGERGAGAQRRGAERARGDDEHQLVHEHGAQPRSQTATRSSAAASGSAGEAEVLGADLRRARQRHGAAAGERRS